MFCCCFIQSEFHSIQNLKMFFNTFLVLVYVSFFFHAFFSCKMYNSSKRREVTIWCACTSDEWLTAYKKRCWSLLHDETGWDTVAQSLTLVDLKWSPPTSMVSWPWWCIDYLSRKNEICFGALFKISKRIVLFYYIFYHNSLW